MRQIETEAAPLRYMAELLGCGTDSERAIRRPIALMVVCCDPLAIVLPGCGFGTEATPEAKKFAPRAAGERKLFPRRRQTGRPRRRS